MNKKYVIIGASAAGISAAQKIRHLDPQAEIVCISDEAESPYNKCLLADFTAGLKQESEIHTLKPEQAEAKNISLMLGKKVVSINPATKSILCDDEQMIAYDKLLIAIGTRPAMPSLEGTATLKGIFNFHRLRDVQAILNYIKENQVKKCLVVGSGLSGLECADSLRSLGIEITVIERSDRLLSSLCDSKGSAFIESAMENHAIKIIKGQSAAKIIEHDGKVSGLLLSDGSQHHTDMVIFAIGLCPNLELAQACGVAIKNQGIVTDEYMQSSVPDIYAAGDVALVYDTMLQCLVPNRTWPDAMFQGIIAAHAMCGVPKKYPGLMSIISSAFFDHKFAACGPVTCDNYAYEIIIRENQNYYHKYLLEGGFLKGFLLIGETDHVGLLKRAILTNTPLSSDLLT